jgi:beta-glucanase (GH16 family)
LYKITGLPYNKYASPQSPNFQSSYSLQYGRVTFNMKTSNTPGAVTCAYLIAPGGDEIDLEMLGGKLHSLKLSASY